MTRLPPVTEADLDERQRAVWDTLLGGRRGDAARLVGGDGALIGPFNALVTAPTVGGPMAALGEAIRFDTDLDRRLQELAIITVGAHFRANFEFWAHRRMAEQAGLAPSVADALAAGEEPTFEADDEATVYRLARSLLTSGRVDDAAYTAARSLLGDEGVVEMVATIGYYAMVSLTLDAFAVPLPPGHDPIWPG